MNGSCTPLGKVAAFNRLVAPICLFLLFASAFGISHALAPLYVQNQNQYFLHGLASVDFGYLSEDWLANTKDNDPLFSLLVGVTYRVLNDSFFYIYFILLSGVYLYALVGIGSNIFNLNSSKIRNDCDPLFGTEFDSSRTWFAPIIWGGHDPAYRSHSNLQELY